MAVEIVGRGNVRISKVLLDTAFLTKMGSIFLEGCRRCLARNL